MVHGEPSTGERHYETPMILILGQTAFLSTLRGSFGAREAAVPASAANEAAGKGSRSNPSREETSDVGSVFITLSSAV